VTSPLIRVLLISLALPLGAAAQEKPQPSAPPPAQQPLADVMHGFPLRVQIVIARYDGEKRISSMPYALSLNGARRNSAQVRMGADVPTAEVVPATEKSGPSVKYQYVGTSIDCILNPGNEGRYVLQLVISEKSVYGDKQAPSFAREGLGPAFRSYASTNTVVLKPGESTQFTAATDRLTGEVVRVEVTLQPTVK
jgi:hypothetical protein